jgi:hypothetical protein
MFELYYRGPEDAARESRLTDDITAAGGRLDFREAAAVDGGSICLTFEFESRAQAESVATTSPNPPESISGNWNKTPGLPVTASG